MRTKYQTGDKKSLKRRFIYQSSSRHVGYEIVRMGLLFRRKMKKRTKIMIGGTLGVLVVGGVVVTQFGKSDEKRTIATTQVQEQPDLKESGVVQPMQIQEVALGSMKPGQILVKDGQTVKAGDALMTMEAADGKADVSEAQAEVTKLQAAVGIQQEALNNAQKAMNSEDGGSQDAVTQAKMALSDAQNDLTLHKPRLQKTSKPRSLQRPLQSLMVLLC